MRTGRHFPLLSLPGLSYAASLLESPQTSLTTVRATSAFPRSRERGHYCPIVGALLLAHCSAERDTADEADEGEGDIAASLRCGWAPLSGLASWTVVETP